MSNAKPFKTLSKETWHKRITTFLPSRDTLLALVLGGLHTLTFAPVPHGGWLAFFTLSALYHLLTRTSTPYAAAQQGFFFGIGHFTSGLAWLVISMHVYGGLSLVLSVILLLLGVFYLSVYPAFAAWAWRTLSWRDANEKGLHWRSSIHFACLWTLTEWLRGTLLSGFPWLVTGYTQVDGPLAGYASLVGVYGVSWFLAWIAALSAQSVVAMRLKTRIIRLALCATLIGMGIIALHTLQSRWTSPQGKALHIRLIQGNIAQSAKISLSNIEDILERYQQLITERAADLIITSETAAPLPIDELPESFTQALLEFSDQTGSSILLGAIGRIPLSTHLDTMGWTNSLFHIAPTAPGTTVYNKRHLVPFGEYIPWGFQKIMAYLQLPLARFANGARQQADFKVKDQIITASICYEDIFGEELARTLRNGQPAAHIMINATNLGWFGNTHALAQHRQMAQMRALETARPVLSAANTGMTVAINPHGRIIAQLPPFTTDSLNVTLQGYTGNTPYIIYGNLPVLIFCVTWLAGAIARVQYFKRPANRLAESYANVPEEQGIAEINALVAEERARQSRDR